MPTRGKINIRKLLVGGLIAGPGTALKAGLASWFFASVLSAAFSVQGVMPVSVWTITTPVLLVEYPVAAVIGARFHSEHGA